MKESLTGPRKSTLEKTPSKNLQHPPAHAGPLGAAVELDEQRVLVGLGLLVLCDGVPPDHVVVIEAERLGAPSLHSSCAQRNRCLGALTSLGGVRVLPCSTLGMDTRC